MKTIQTIQIVTLGLLFPFISLAQQSANSLNEFPEYVKDTVEITIPDDNKIIFIADSLDIFNKMNIDSLFQVVKQEMGGSFINTSDKHITKTFTLDSIPNPTVKQASSNWLSGRSIYLGIDLLTGLIKNDLSPGLSFMLAVSPSKKGPIGGFLSADMYYFFPKSSLEKTALDINTFINAGLIFDQRHRRYLGVGMVGSGKQFEKSTFKLFIGQTLQNTPFIICPELYFVNGFKKVFPGITLRLDL
ncbi:MAG: hypothetical protein FWD60_02010 [Candidatus Azobacteroides sp.]|nr:hypothetical protein [Candidatus Azobacteroides sp.]